MGNNTVTIRMATPEDAPRLAEIYAPYVLQTAISFEYSPPDAPEFRRRMERTLEAFPYLVAEIDGVIVGYAYAGPFIPRPAYDRCAEASIYVARSCHRRGVGRALYQRLEQLLRDMGILNLYACVGYPEAEDEYLTFNSPRFHEHMGFKTVGIFRNCGFKFDRWYHMVWMEKILAPHTLPPTPRKSLLSD